MRARTVLTLAVPAAALTVAALLTTGAKTPTFQRVDFGVTRTATNPAYDARLAPVGSATVKEFRIPITDDTVEIAPGVRYAGWTFGGTIPGPAIRVREGDRVRIKLVNEAPDMPHSIDFHAARIPMDHAMKTIMPHDSLTFEFTPTVPGAFLVHCGTPPVLMHISQGMYLAIIVDPKDGWPTKADKEFVLVQSEFFPQPVPGDTALKEADWTAMQDDRPTYMAFNGRADQYKANPLQVDEGDRVRFFVVNAGPNRPSAFHIVGTILDAVYPDGRPDRALHGVQTWEIPAGGAAVVETTFEKGLSGAGTYAFVTHAFADATKGALGLIKVTAPAAVATTAATH